MKQKKSKKTLLFILSFIVTILISISCSDKNELADLTKGTPSTIKTKSGAYDDGYFAWDSITEIKTIDNRGRSLKIALPWTPGSAQNSGIPNDWIDQNAESSNYENRYYSRNNGWRLVYSNINRESEVNKYFALYNEYTGTFRIFFYAISESVTAGTSYAFLGMNIDRSSSLFNFTNSIAEAIDVKKAAPSIISSPGWTFATTSKNVGFKENTWYGMEFECAYDPEALVDSKFNFAVWAADEAKITGEATTKGEIKGTITSTAPSMPNLSLNFDNSTNNTTTNNSNVILDLSSSQTVLINTIDEGVKKNDSFFKGLWGNISGNISKWIGSGVTSGVKEGLKAVFTSGGSVITKVLGNVVSSLFGGGKENVSKVDLGLTAKTEITATSVKEVIGGGKVSPFPLPGVSNITNRLYNHPLGVWNIDKTPLVKVNLLAQPIYNSKNISTKSVCYYFYELQTSNLVLNPIVKANFNVENYREDLVYPYYKVDASTPAEPYALIGSEKYYYSQNNNITSKSFISSSSNFIDLASCPEFKVRISFDLVNKNTKVTYSFSKYYTAKNIKGTVTIGSLE